jgi:chromosome segregation ATPase
MEEQTDRSASEEGPDQRDRGRSENEERLIARVAGLRDQLEAIAPPDQMGGRQALDRIRDADERIETLEAMLASARMREHELTLQAIRDRAQVAEYEGQVSELGTIAARVAEAEVARREAESAAEERVRALAVAEADVVTLRIERDRLRSRCAELEADLRSLSADIAEAAIARTEAARLERERNQARERAQAERKLAAADRIRAEEAERRATELQSRLRAAERRIVQVANRIQEGARSAAEKEEERTVPEPPWLELQRATKDPEERAADQGELPLQLPQVPAKPGDPEPYLIDLTGDHRTSGGDPPTSSTKPGGDSVLSRLIHPRRKQ